MNFAFFKLLRKEYAFRINHHKFLKNLGYGNPIIWSFSIFKDFIIIYKDIKIVWYATPWVLGSCDLRCKIVYKEKETFEICDNEEFEKTLKYLA